MFESWYDICTLRKMNGEVTIIYPEETLILPCLLPWSREFFLLPGNLLASFHGAAPQRKLFKSLSTALRWKLTCRLPQSCPNGAGQVCVFSEQLPGGCTLWQKWYRLALAAVHRAAARPAVPRGSGRQAGTCPHRWTVPWRGFQIPLSFLPRNPGGCVMCVVILRESCMGGGFQFYCLSGWRFVPRLVYVQCSDKLGFAQIIQWRSHVPLAALLTGRWLQDH